MRTVVAIVIASGLASLQDKNEAEELFRKMEVKLGNAKTIQWRVSGKSEKGNVEATFEGACFVAENNKANVEWSLTAKNTKFTFRLLSDGKESLITSGSIPPVRTKAPDTLNKLIVFNFTRIGIMGTIPVPNSSAAKREVKEIEKQIALENFKLIGREKLDDREVCEVEFQVKIVDRPEVIVTRLWIDSESCLPTKRQVETLLNGKKVHTYTESYVGMQLDKDLDEAKFALPK